jgi:hypothetical protein
LNHTALDAKNEQRFESKASKAPSVDAALAPLSRTFVAPTVALPPFKHHSEQRLEDFDRVDTHCSVPRSRAEEAMATDAISAAAASSDASIRAAFGQGLLSAFRERGFLRLRLSAEELALVRELDRIQYAFFAQTRDMKDPSFDPTKQRANRRAIIRKRTDIRARMRAAKSFSL